MTNDKDVVTADDVASACPRCGYDGHVVGDWSADANSSPVRHRCPSRNCEAVSYWVSADGRKHVTKRVHQ